MLVVTTDDLPGYEVRKVIGEVIGVTGRTRNPFREGVRKLHGGGNPQLIKALTRWRLEAVEDMTAHARKLGANAVVGMRFDHRNVSDMWTEICAYGTAVCVVQLGAPAAPRPQTPADPEQRPQTPADPAQPRPEPRTDPHAVAPPEPLTDPHAVAPPVAGGAG